MIVIIDENELQKAQEISSHESIMMSAVQGVNSADELQATIDSDDDYDQVYDELVKKIGTVTDTDESMHPITFKMLICDSNNAIISSKELLRSVGQAMSDYGLFGNVEHHEQLSHNEGDFRLKCLFGGDERFQIFAVRAKSQYVAVNHFSRIVANWDFSVKSYRGYILIQNYAETIDDHETTTKTTTNCNVVIQDIKSCSVGFLQSSQMFYSQHQLGCSAENNIIINYHTVEIDQYPNCIIKIIGNVANSTTTVTIEIDRSTLGSCVFLSAADHGSRSFSLYLHITSTPLMNLHNNGTCRVCVSPTGSFFPQEQKDLLAFSSFPVLQLNFSLDSWEKIFEVVCNAENFSLPCLATRIVAADKSESCSHFPDIVPGSHLAWDLYWSYSVLLCSLKHSIAANPRVIGLLHHEFNSVVSDRSGTNSESMVYVFQQLALRLQSINPWSNLEDSLLKCKAIAENSQGISVYKPSQYSCYRLVVTPSNVTFLSQIPIQSSRLIREFGSTHRLVYVHFRNENLDLTYNANFANSRVLSILSNGLQVNGWMKLNFLCCSNSQIRQSSSIFIQASSEVVLKLKHSLIPKLSDFQGDFAKKISRFGLFATSDCDVGILSSNSIKVICDDLTPGSAILTDGAGLIPRSLLVQIIKSNDNNNFESEELSMKFLRTSNAIQIRHMGYKGVLTIIDDVDVLSPRLKESFSPSHALMRKSMEKFDSPHDKLGVVKVSYNMPLKLNRDMLNLLFSFSGEGQHGGDFNPFLYIFQLQEKQLQKYADGLVYPTAAEAMLRDFIDDKILFDAMQSCIALTDEPYFRGLLTTIYHHKTASLRQKTHIPVNEGSMLMGIPDFSDSLEDGQVFVQIERGEETINITGNVLVYRNPCLDPADLRILDAVAVHLVPKLKDIKNVIVFPNKHLSSTVSVSAQCSGGDLDGDLFSVIWEKNLIPPKAREYSPLNYDDIVKEGKRKQQSVSTPKSEAEFLVKCMSSPLLGKIAKSHLAISDHLPNGSADPLARELAQAASLAVDFPKTGIAPTISRVVKDLLRQKGYPDFMEMPNRMSYPSKKPLGKLYQRCMSIIYGGDIRDISVELDPLLVHPDSSMFEQSAIDICNEYTNSISAIQHRYSLTSENELILGLAPLGKNQEFIGLKREMIESSMKRDWNDIVQYFRKKIIDLLPPSVSDDRYKLASALYQAAYKTCRENNRGVQCLGLPWICSDFLMEYRRMRIKEASVAYDSKGGSTLLKVIGKQILKQWNETVPLLRSSQLERMKFFASFVDTLQKVASKSIPPFDIIVKLYGSCSHFLCDAASDLDVFVEASPTTVHKSLQTNQLYDMLSSFCTTVQLKGTVLRCTCELNTSDTGTEEIHLDVGTTSTDGLEKAELLRRLYIKYPHYLVIFSYCHEWGKACGLIRSSNIILQERESVSQIRPGEFHALLLHILSNLTKQSYKLDTLRTEQCDSNEEIFGNNEFNEETINFFLNRQIGCAPDELGEMLLGIFSYGSQMSKDLVYTWPIPSNAVHKLDSTLVQLFATFCLRSVHILGCTRSADLLLEQIGMIQSTTMKFIYRLPYFVGSAIRSSKDHFEFKLSISTGATIKFEFPNNYAYCQLIAEGTPSQIRHLKKEINQMIFYRKTFSAMRRWEGTSVHRYFLQNCNLLQFRNFNSTAKRSAVVCCKPYLQYNQASPHHTGYELSTVALVVHEQNADEKSWMNIYVEALVDKFITQTDKALADNVSDESLERLSFNAHIGKFYLIGAISTMKGAAGNMSVEQLESDLTAARRNITELKDVNHWDLNSLPKNYDCLPSNTAATSSSSSVGAPNEKVFKTFEKQHVGEAKKSLSCGYWNGCTSSNFIKFAIDQPHKFNENADQLCECLDSLLTQLGFKKGLQPDLLINEFATNYGHWVSKVHWIIEVSPSKSLEIRILLDENRNVISVQERKCGLVLSTILHSDSVTQEDCDESMLLKFHDVRWRLDLNSKELDPTSDVRMQCTPGGEPPIEFNARDEPVPSKAFLDGKLCSDSVSFTRHIIRKVPYLKKCQFELAGQEMPYILAVDITCGYHYYGSSLEIKLPFFEFGIEVDKTIIKKFIKRQIVESDFSRWVDDVARQINELSESISSLSAPMSDS